MIEPIIDTLLDNLSNKYGFDRSDTNLLHTGRRVADAYDELLGGYKEDPKELLKVTFSANNYNQMIVCKDIDFYSLCAHHMLPFFGKIAVGYLPKMGFGPDANSYVVVGLSKLARVCQVFARRLQIQERLTQQIAEAIQKHLEPIGLGVVVYDVKHLCMLMRGVKQHSSTMDTSCMKGEFMHDAAVRAEFFSMIGK